MNSQGMGCKCFHFKGIIVIDAFLMGVVNFWGRKIFETKQSSFCNTTLRPEN